MKKTWKPVMAGVLQIMTSIPYLAGSVMLFIFPKFIHDESGLTYQLWWPLGLVLWLPWVVPLWVGGICAIKRKSWVVALISPILPLFMTALLIPYGYPGIEVVFVFNPLSTQIRMIVVNSIYALMAIAALLLLIARKEFMGMQSAAEYIYSPPKWMNPYRD